MKISQIGYDTEHEAIVFEGEPLRRGDALEILIPSPTHGEFTWIPVKLEWERWPRERWYFVGQDPELQPVLDTCDPVGLFARK